MKNKTQDLSIGCSSNTLLIVFLVLKLTHLINWSWVWVLSPLWIGFALWILLGLGIFLIAIVFEMLK